MNKIDRKRVLAIAKEIVEKIWLHSRACAYCAKTLVEKLNQKDTEKYFTIGLSHDIGVEHRTGFF